MKFETIRTLSRSSLLAKLSHRRRRVLVREVIKTLMVTLVELHDLIWRWEKLTEGQTSLRHSTNMGLMAKWPNSSFSSVKIHGIYKIHPNNSWLWKKKWLSGLMNLNSLFMSEGNQALLITCIIPSQRWSMVVAASCSGGGGGSVAGTGEVIREDGKLNAAKYREILNENLVQSTQNLRLGWKFTFQHDNHPPHTAKTMQEWLRDSMNVLEWPSQSWDLEPIRQIWRNL